MLFVGDFSNLGLRFGSEFLDKFLSLGLLLPDLLLLFNDEQLGLLNLPRLIVLRDGSRHLGLGDPHCNNLDSGSPLLAALLQGILETLIKLVEVINEHLLQRMTGAKLVDLMASLNEAVYCILLKIQV
jgi:hypothetical protein